MSCNLSPRSYTCSIQSSIPGLYVGPPIYLRPDAWITSTSLSYVTLYDLST